uniref:L1 transposable element RRM domain-containing protein n=1 Tax=Latimeria chalumnae TaxID=7897 RepID=H3AZD9_LATCH
ITHLDQLLNTFTNRMEEVEECIGKNEDAVDGLVSTVNSIQNKVKLLLAKCDDLENRSRKGAEGENAGQFLESWLPKLLDLPHLPHKLEIERAHRALIPRPPLTARPRMIICKLLRFQDKELLPRRAREFKTLTYQGTRIQIFPDLSAELYRRRKEFDPMKCLCRDLNIPFALLHPAKPKINANSRQHLFSSPADAEGFLKAIAQRGGSQGPMGSRGRP